MTAPADLVERVRLVRVSPTLAYADVRLAQVHLCALRVEVDGRGELRLIAPVLQVRQGQPRPAYCLQPGAAEAVAQAIRELWHGPGLPRA